MLEFSDVSRRYDVAGGAVVALDNVSAAFPPGSLTTVVGRSGCGKTTLLRLAAGLTEPSGGSVQRTAERIGVVFQDARLMPWLDVAANVAFGLRGRLPPAEIDARVAAMLALVGLERFQAAYPAQLSGGMAQRVAIARALVIEPDLMLLDEPFAALDAFTRRVLQGELIALWQRRRPTVLLVTHDVEEAVLMGETIIEMEAGRLVGRHAIALPFPRDPTDPAVVGHRRAVLDRLIAGPRFPVAASGVKS